MAFLTKEEVQSLTKMQRFQDNFHFCSIGPISSGRKGRPSTCQQGI